MNWFFIALGAPFLWTLVNLSDKYLVTRYTRGVRGSGALVLFSSFVGLFVAAIIAFFSKSVFRIPTSDKLLLLLMGGLTVAWVIFYLFTLEIEDISSVVPWFLTVPIFGYIQSYFFLGETLSRQQLLGSLIILSGAFLISIDFSGQKNKFKWRTASYMLTACFLIAIIGVIFKYITVGGDFWVSSFWQYAGLGVSGVLIFLFVPKYRKEFIEMNKEGGKTIFALNATSETLTVIGNLLSSFALLLAPVTMVYLVGSFQPALMLFLVFLTSKFFPNIIKESFSANALLPKVVAIVLMIAGSVFLLI